MDTMGNLQIQLTATDSKGAEKRGIFALTVTKNHEPALSAPLADAAGKAGEDFKVPVAPLILPKYCASSTRRVWRTRR